MINDLETVLALSQRHAVREFFVSRQVFLEVLRDAGRHQGLLLLNRPYDSPSFRFLNKALWRGVMLVCVSNDVISREAREPAGST